MATYSRDEINSISAQYVISPKLLQEFSQEASDSRETPVRLPVIIELNLDHPGQRSGARREVEGELAKLQAQDAAVSFNSDLSRHHVFARLTLEQVKELVRLDSPSTPPGGPKTSPAIYKIWPDRDLDPYLDRSVRTIKADACLRSFGADGANILWAVVDSGIDKFHPHFADHANLDLPVEGLAPARSPRPASDSPLEHHDYTGGDAPLVDLYGHGTHVAGIIAGELPHAHLKEGKPAKVYRLGRRRDAEDKVRQRIEPLSQAVRGVAPRAKLLSLKVLDKDGKGKESFLLAALDYVARANDDGRWLRIHGVNISLGYGFEAEWFAAGQSPICVAVNRLVKQGVVVVVAAGNDGSAMIKPELAAYARRVGLHQSITDPGNAEYAITVGSTHPEQPHNYGVSYFSSRGPTADGREKPDLLAPGERILSCAAPSTVEAALPDLEFVGEKPVIDPRAVYYREESGTSMAAPHVSGAVAAFLSIRPEFIGRAEEVKAILLASATDLKRRRELQGAGLLDLMRALQSI